MVPSAVFASWLAAVAAVPLSLLAAGFGQGFGTVVVGGKWIGLCLAWDRGVWALVNQPAINFAASWAATGYWLGAWALVFSIAVAALPLSLRLKHLDGQLFVIQSAWIALVIGASWQVFLDGSNGKLARWLGFHELPLELRWFAVVAAAAAAVPIVLRLLAVARITRFNLGRGRRLALVVVHLLPVPTGWAVISAVIREDLPVESVVGAAVPMVTALVVAWVGYPAPLTHGVTGLRPRVFAILTVTVLAAWSILVVAGRPLPDHRTAAIQWAHDNPINNIRPWMEPWRAPWLDEDSTAADRSNPPG